ncbi:hypothetical protein [Dyadobacter fermentans]|uniref:RNA ligase domain-containing protein n=1 Tax=Dyadobacter fermentans (strain ATCC 700827 / DSM 18053 / CIP 107007 / KCTC 52180 / NS114) TaxID=471854 RepID=C6VXS2_DYAFD|nr:hypothetical protein [Dyadobacter fermentans]ACT95105.1 conserved hypothetical protein [Dyadobacter fermentans DSM 18053]
MEKIPTIYERNWSGDRKVIDVLSVTDFDFDNSDAAEKLDGTNVRITVRNGYFVRLEKRRNPSKEEKIRGISEPWYIDANLDGPADQYLFEAAKNTDLSEVPDGEWSAEALGEKIQGNPLHLEGHTLFIFSLESWREKILFKDVPTSFSELRTWLDRQKSIVGNDCGIEGIVWHERLTGRMCKIKRKDFG